MDKGKVPFNLSADQIGSRLHSRRVNDLSGLPVVFAQRDTLGWAALLAGPANGDALPADLELLFNAATIQPDRLALALSGRELGAYPKAFA
jgi:hypothetical protein